MRHENFSIPFSIPALFIAMSAALATPSFADSADSARSNVARDPGVTCANIVDKLKDLRTSTQATASEIVRIVNDAANVMSSWYGQLSSSEGQTVFVPYGAYSTIGQSASTEAGNAVTFQTDFNTLDSNFADLLTALPTCLKGAH